MQDDQVRAPDIKSLAKLIKTYPDRKILFFTAGQWLAVGCDAAGFGTLLAEMPGTAEGFEAEGIPVPMLLIQPFKMQSCIRAGAATGVKFDLLLVPLDGSDDDFLGRSLN